MGGGAVVALWRSLRHAHLPGGMLAALGRCCSTQLPCGVVARLVSKHLAAPPPHEGYTTSLRNVRRGGMAAGVAAH